MSKLMTGVAIGVVATALTGAAIWGVTQMFSSGASEPEVQAEGNLPKLARNGVVDLICELHLDIDGQKALGIQGNEPSRMTMAQVDLDKKSGWYQGKIAISESRGGTVSVTGTKFIVTRPAMFERFGVMINQEQFTVDRTSGEFVQSLGITDGRTINLIKGTCAQVVKAPF